MPIKINPLSNGSADDKPFDVPDPLPKTAFFINTCGERGSGKTVLIQNLIQIYKKEMDYIIFMSPSIRRNDDYDFIKEDGEKVYKFDKVAEFEDIIKEMIKSQDDLLVGGDREDVPNVLLVLDDILECNICGRGGLIEKISFNGRHMKISVILAGQAFKAISNRTRGNSDLSILFSCTNLNEMNKYIQEFVHPIHRKPVTDKLAHVFDEPYSFITVIGRLIATRLKLNRVQRLLWKFDHPLLQE